MSITNSHMTSGHETNIHPYANGSTAIVALVLITLVTSIVIEISRQIDYSGEINFFAQYVGLWKLVAGITTGFLSLHVVRLALRLWQKRYGIHSHKVITAAGTVGLLVGIFTSTLYDGMLWFKWYVALPAGLFPLTDTAEWNAVFSSLPNVWRMASLAVGIALIAFGLQGWNQRNSNGKLGFPRTLTALIGALGALLIVDIIVGLRLIPINGYYIDRYYNPLAAVGMATLVLMLFAYLFFAFKAKLAIYRSQLRGVS
jgi:hypothetical protein